MTYLFFGAGSFCFGTTPSEGSLGGIVSIYHIDKHDSVWGRAYGVGSPRPFNWTYAWDGPAFVNVSANAFRKCGQFTDADAELAGYHGLGSEDSILAALKTVFAGNVNCTKTPGKGQCDGW